MTKRQEFADIAKAFAIFAVIVGHTYGIPAIVSQFVFSFHMPIFFILSGYFMKPAKNSWALIKKDVKGLLLPYAATSVLMVLLAAVLAFLREESVWLAAKTWTLAALFGSGTMIADWATGVCPIGAIWFLLALFEAKVFLRLCEHLKHYKPIGVIVVVLLGFIITKYTWLPLSLLSGMTATGYLYVGQLIKQYDLFNKTYKPERKIGYLVFVIAFAIWVYCIINCGHLYMVTNYYGNGMLDVLGSICATFVIIWISMLIENKFISATKFLSAIGRNTLIILCAHILELNVFPWDIVYGWLGVEITWYIAALLRIVLITLMCVIYFGFKKLLVKRKG